MGNWEYTSVKFDNKEIFILTNVLENVACKISLKATASNMIFCDQSYNPSAG